MEAARAWSNLSSSRLQIQGGRMESLAQKHCLLHTEGLCGSKVLTPGTSEYEDQQVSLCWLTGLGKCSFVMAVLHLTHRVNILSVLQPLARIRESFSQQIYCNHVMI